MDKSAGLEKSESAFRTIGEVSDEIGVPQHVLRYWETRFPQLKPITRAGNRRYYRPADVALVRRIHDLLGQEGYTVKGVQRLLAARPAAAGAPQPAAIMVPAQPAANAPQPAVALSPASAMLAELIAIRERLKAALETSAA